MRRITTLALLLLLVAGLCYLWSDDALHTPSVGPDARSDAGVQAKPREEKPQLKKPVGEEEVRAPVARPPSGKGLYGRLQLPDGQPAAGLKLGLYRGWPSEVWLSESTAATKEKAESSCVTDTAGRFSLSTSESGKFRMRLMSEDYVFMGSDPESRRVNVEDFDRLDPVIVGRVASIRGTVLANGRGVPGVEIVVGRPPAGFGAGLFAAFRPAGQRAESGANGEFFVRSVRPGRVSISSRSPNHLPVELVREVTPGEAVTGVVFELQVGGFLEGMVVDDRGVPIAEAKVEAARETELAGGVRFKGFRSGEATLTDESGWFRLAGFAKPTAHLRATKDGFAGEESGNIKVGQADVVLRLDRLGEVHGVLVDQAGQPIAGSEVSARLLEGALVRNLLHDGTRFSAKTGEFTLLKVFPGTNRISAESVLAPHADASIEVQVSPGEVVKGVRLVAPVGATLTVTVVGETGYPVSGARVKIRSRLDPENLVDPETIVFSTGSKGTRTSTSIKSTRKALKSARKALSGGGWLGDEAVTDASGRAVFHGLPSVSAVVKATYESPDPAKLTLGESWRNIIFSRYVLRRPEEVQIPEKGQVSCRLIMEQGGFVTVTTVDSRGEIRPSTKFLIAREGDGAGVLPTHETGTSGQVRLGPLGPGRYLAAIQPPSKAGPLGGMVFVLNPGKELGLPGSEVPFVVRPGGQPETVRLVFPVLTTVHGTVRDAAGLVRGAEVNLVKQGELALPFGGHQTKSDADGRFELSGVNAGDYLLKFGRLGAAVAGEVEIKLLQGQPKHEQNVMIPGGSLSLRAIDAAGSAGVEGARVTLTRVRRGPSGEASRTSVSSQSRVKVVGVSSGLGGGSSSTVTVTAGANAVETDAEGHATVRDLPAGRYQLEVAHNRFARFSKEVDLSKDQTLQVGVIKLSQGGSLRGRIKWETPPIVSMAVVQLTDGEGTVQRDGIQVIRGSRFTFDGLRPGIYRVRVRSGLQVGWVESDPVQVVAGKTERVNLTIPSKK